MSHRTETPAYFVCVEEFIPRNDAQQMLKLVENAERMAPDSEREQFLPLLRQMAWMIRYIAPASEFWEWSSQPYSIGEDIVLTFQQIGFGWAVILSSGTARTFELVREEEQRLVACMDQLVRGIPVRAILRIKASEWKRTERRKFARELSRKGVVCRSRGRALEFPRERITIATAPMERLRCPCISRTMATNVQFILGHMKTYANKRHEGSSWCAYERRRLTLIRKVGITEPAEADRALLMETRSDPRGTVLESRIKTIKPVPTGMPSNTLPDALNETLGTFSFVREPYHTGNIHPRALICAERAGPVLDAFAVYVFYLWNAHFTRIWLYLQFEDAYAYAENLRSSEIYVDPKIRHYWERLVGIDEIISLMEAQERVDNGVAPSFQPPHDRFAEHPSSDGMGQTLPIDWLRNTLIEASTTRLSGGPLEQAVKLLENMNEHTKTALDLFVQTVAIGNQKVLQILQLLFVIAAVGEVLQVVGIGSALSDVIVENIKTLPLLSRFAIRFNGLSPLTIQAVVYFAVNAFLLFVLSGVTLALFKSPFIRRLLDRVMR